jgi:hypothetical protein
MVGLTAIQRELHSFMVFDGLRMKLYFFFVALMFHRTARYRKPPRRHDGPAAQVETRRRHRQPTSVSRLSFCSEPASFHHEYPSQD